MSRRAVVTGGSGFIGAHLCEALAKCGWSVVSLDDHSAGRRPVGPGRGKSPTMETQEVDITDRRLARVMARIRPQVVFHLAAVSSESRCQADPARCMEVNVEGTAAVLRAAGRIGAAKVVNVSSLAVHGVGLSNDSPSYGFSKKAAEELVGRTAGAAGIDWVTLRPANVYGPGQLGDGESAVVATWLQAMAAGGAVFLDGDGRQTRDFLYVEDAVAALIRAADRADGMTLEVGAGVETSLRELLEAMREVTGWQGSPRSRPARPGDIRRSVTDPRPAAQALGWRAQTDLRTGLSKTWEWMRA